MQVEILVDVWLRSGSRRGRYLFSAQADKPENEKRLVFTCFCFIPIIHELLSYRWKEKRRRFGPLQLNKQLFKPSFECADSSHPAMASGKQAEGRRL